MPVSQNYESFFKFTFKSEAISLEREIISLCLFYSESIQNESIFKIRLSDFVKDFDFTSDVANGVINKLILILPATEKCRQFAEKPFFDQDIDKHRFSFLTSEGNPICLLYDKGGNWSFGNNQSFPDNTLAELVAEIKLFGLHNIFEAGNGILESSPNHHYILQNEFHSDKFIRTANILTNSSFIDFIAAFLLPFVSEETSRIYIDTSGIASLIYATNKLRSIFVRNSNPCVVSFNSYSGISSLVKDDTSRIVISASTSGKLSKALVDEGFSSDKVCILFYLNEENSNVFILCNLSHFKKIDKSEKYSPFKIEKESQCSFCANSSYPIKIVGEQFLPEELQVDTFSFDVTDRPLWLTKFMRQYFHREGDILTAYTRINTSSPKRDVFLYFERIFQISQSDIRLQRFFASKLPHEIEIIIYYSDSGSIFLKDIILKKYDKTGKPKVIEDSQLKEQKAQLKNKNILVISSTITNGRRIVETSLKLRDANCKGICYFVGMSRTPDEYTLETTRRYVGFDNNLGRDINPLVVVDSIFPSDINAATTFAQPAVSAWQEELELIRKWSSTEKFKARIDLLDRGGLINDLFWGNCHDEALRLRPNFAFYMSTTLNTVSTTQAEVFFILNTIMHNLRRNSNKKIFQSTFHRHVLSPEAFIMYNDGIIQASILRSATPVEMNYNFLGAKMKIAAEMINVLRYIFHNFDNEIGEATLEFLIAISTKRLQVVKKELEVVIGDLVRNVTSSNVANKQIILTLCDHINQTILL